MGNVPMDGKEGRPLILTWDDDTREKTETPLLFEEDVLVQLKNIVYSTINRKGDFLIVIDGEEGSGKTNYSGHVGKVIAHYAQKKLRRKIRFTAKNNYCYRAHTFIEKAIQLPHYTPIVFDEAKSTADRKSANSKTNKKLTNFMSEMRESYHKFVIIVLPKIHDLDSYISQHRARLLFHFVIKINYNEKGIAKERLGYYEVHGKKNIRKISNKLRKGDKEYYPKKRHFGYYYAHKNRAVDPNVLSEHKRRITKQYADGYKLPTIDSVRDEIVAQCVKKYESGKFAEKKITLRDVYFVLGISDGIWYRVKRELEEARKNAAEKQEIHL